MRGGAAGAGAAAVPHGAASPAPRAAAPVRNRRRDEGTIAMASLPVGSRQRSTGDARRSRDSTRAEPLTRGGSTRIAYGRPTVGRRVRSAPAAVSSSVLKQDTGGHRAVYTLDLSAVTRRSPRRRPPLLRPDRPRDGARALVDRFVIPIRSGRAWPVRAGQICRVVVI